jgi:predicted methyltransferase
MLLNTKSIGIAMLLAASVLVPVAASAQTSPGYITAAVKDPGRPAADVQADDYRKPAASMLFAGVKPGDKILELLGMGGYYTRLLSKAVGDTGHVYTTVPAALQTVPMFSAAAKAISSNPSYSNVTVLVQAAGAPSAPVPVDIVWLTDNYHDLHNPGPLAAGDIDAFNKAVFNALKPGGIFFVIDHATAPGMGLSQTSSLHRIDPETTKAEIEKAGFVFNGQSDVLHRADEDYTKHSNFHDEQFVFRFRKPR